MVTEYTIYLVNRSNKPQLFWAFLSKPEITNSPTVFANSNTNLRIPGGSQDLNSFTIPIQYVIAVGGSNNAVKLETRIESNSTRNTDLNKLWAIDYTTVPPNQGPIVPAAATGESTAETIAMQTSAFDPVENASKNWFESMSFGLKTAQGFMGVTWVPAPSLTYTIRPKLTFYITVGDYSANSLAEITTVSNRSAACNVPSSFDVSKQCTVTYSRQGTWSVEPGKPDSQLLMRTRELMIQSVVTTAYCKVYGSKLDEGPGPFAAPLAEDTINDNNPTWNVTHERTKDSTIYSTTVARKDPLRDAVERALPNYNYDVWETRGR